MTRVIAAALNNIRRRNRDKLFAADVAGSGVNVQIAPAVLRPRHHLQYFAGAFEVDLITVGDLTERVRRTGWPCAQLRPDRWILRAESPDSETGGLETTRRAHLVESRHGVEKPNGVMRFVFVVVLEGWRARGRIENYLRLRVARRNHRLLKSQFRGFLARSEEHTSELQSH